MSKDIVPYEGQLELQARLQKELEAALEKARDTEGTILNDLQAALNLIRAYQRHLGQFHSPDPSFVEARNLLRKYGMTPATDPPTGFRIFANGIDITEHPDSIQSTVTSVEEITEGVERAELVVDNETGKMGLVPIDD